MYDFSVGVVVLQCEGPRLEVFCNRCDMSIGIMDHVTVVRALFNTLGRGGVLCPSCRRVTCDVCGRQPADKRSLFVDERLVKSEIKMCAPCASSYAELEDKLKELSLADLWVDLDL